MCYFTKKNVFTYVASITLQTVLRSGDAWALVSSVEGDDCGFYSCTGPQLSEHLLLTQCRHPFSCTHLYKAVILEYFATIAGDKIKPVRCTIKSRVAVAEWLARPPATQEVWHPTSAETCMWGKQLAAMLAIYTGRGVAPEVNLREHISHTPPQSSNKAEPTLALKSRGDITRSPKQGYQWSHKWTCVQQKFKKKKQKKDVQ